MRLDHTQLKHGGQVFSRRRLSGRNRVWREMGQCSREHGRSGRESARGTRGPRLERADSGRTRPHAGHAGGNRPAHPASLAHRQPGRSALRLRFCLLQHKPEVHLLDDRSSPEIRVAMPHSNRTPTQPTLPRIERVGANPDEFRSAIAAQHADALRLISVELVDDALDDHLPKGTASRKGPLRTSGSAQEVSRRSSNLSGRNDHSSTAPISCSSPPRVSTEPRHEPSAT